MLAEQYISLRVNNGCQCNRDQACKQALHLMSQHDKEGIMMQHVSQDRQEHKQQEQDTVDDVQRDGYLVKASECVRCCPK